MEASRVALGLQDKATSAMHSRNSLIHNIPESVSNHALNRKKVCITTCHNHPNGVDYEPYLFGDFHLSPRNRQVEKCVTETAPPCDGRAKCKHTPS